MGALTREKNGRFLPGTPPGPGRPPRQTEAGYMQVMMGACDLNTWREVCEKAVADAKAGDSKSREWLARYLIGDPGHQAPTPLAVIVQQLMGGDAALDRAAGLMAAAASGDFLGLASPDEIEKARASILQTELQSEAAGAMPPLPDPRRVQPLPEADDEQMLSKDLVEGEAWQ